MLELNLLRNYSCIFKKTSIKVIGQDATTQILIGQDATSQILIGQDATAQILIGQDATTQILIGQDAIKKILISQHATTQVLIGQRERKINWRLESGNRKATCVNTVSFILQLQCILQIHMVFLV